MTDDNVISATTTPIRGYRLTPVSASDVDPEFIRLPPPRGRCKYCGLSRTTLIEYLPFIRHVRLRKDGSKRAIILIHLASLREFFQARMSTPKQATVNRRKGGAALQ